ncbi:MAG: ECF-type sigma factor, partial [Bacteroidota bacterium]
MNAPDRQHDVTQLLVDISEGREQAYEKLLPLIYDELRRLAHFQRGRLRQQDTLNTTALVHEAYLKLADRTHPAWQDSTHFFRIASRAMRDITVDYARHKRAAKRGGEHDDLPLDQAFNLSEEKAQEVLDLHEALEQLEATDPQLSQIVEMRYFVGFTIAETADALGSSPATIKRAWATARAWLHREMRG